MRCRLMKLQLCFCEGALRENENLHMYSPAAALVFQLGVICYLLNCLILFQPTAIHINSSKEFCCQVQDRIMKILIINGVTKIEVF